MGFSLRGFGFGVWGKRAEGGVRGPVFRTPPTVTTLRVLAFRAGVGFRV